MGYIQLLTMRLVANHPEFLWIHALRTAYNNNMFRQLLCRLAVAVLIDTFSDCLNLCTVSPCKMTCIAMFAHFSDRSTSFSIWLEVKVIHKFHYFGFSVARYLPHLALDSVTSSSKNPYLGNCIIVRVRNHRYGEFVCVCVYLSAFSNHFSISSVTLGTVFEASSYCCRISTSSRRFARAPCSSVTFMLDAPWWIDRSVFMDVPPVTSVKSVSEDSLVKCEVVIVGTAVVLLLSEVIECIYRHVAFSGVKRKLSVQFWSKQLP